MKILVVGDIHMEFGELNKLINQKKPDMILACGDFGYWPNVPWGLPLSTIKLQGAKKLLWCDGNHECMHKETEILTENGWKKLYDITLEDKVATVDLENNEIVYQHPKTTIKKYQKDMIEFEGDRTKQVVSFNHDVIYENKKQKAIELYKQELKINDFPLTSSRNNNTDYDIEDSVLCLLLWIIADATVIDFSKRNKNSKKLTIQFKLSKERKIKRLQFLLNEANIKYAINKIKDIPNNRLPQYCIRIYSDDARYLYTLLNKKKDFPMDILRNLSLRQSMLVFDELKITDGSPHGKIIVYKSTSIDDVNAIQELCCLNGVNSYISTSKQNPKAFGTKDIYTIRIGLYKIRSNKIRKNIIEYNDYSYCVETETGTILTRIDGKIAITGNCHWALRDRTTDELAPNIIYMPRGSTYTLPDGRTILFMGGADSIDKYRRTEGVDWFREEVITQSDFENLPDPSTTKIDIFITHTCPSELVPLLKLNYPEKGEEPSNHALSTLWDMYNPKLWFFGHWHQYMSTLEEESGTQFYCLSAPGLGGRWWMWLPEK